MSEGFSSVPDDVEVLRALVAGTASGTGAAFLESLARQLAIATGARYAFVAEFVPPSRARTLAFWFRDRLEAAVEWELAGTPCEEVVAGRLCHHPRGVQVNFPDDRPLVELGIESYLGVPLRDANGTTLGHLAIFDEREMPDEPRRVDVFRIFAARAAAELERMRADQELLARERSYRDLFEEAPIAYIYEDLESRFVRANRAACRLLGIRPEEVTQTYGKDLLAPDPENVRRVEQALAAMKTRGAEFSWVELELRRKDDGRPVWVRWWSRPEPDGKHTRTMIVDITDQVRMAREKARLEEQNLYLREEIQTVHNYEEIVGSSPALLRVLDAVGRVAPTDAAVLITGETGTGKELIARAVHSRSPRREKPLIKVNCAALPTGLVESELFGHERGAFSGAIARRIGRFELAHGGTIFLDEVGEIPPDVQVKLLRVLQEKEFERVGGNVTIRADVRVISATNRDLQRAVAEGRFRQDLYYRIAVFPLHLPPLRERKSDIPLLTRFIVDRFGARVGKRIRSIPEGAVARLSAYLWPGNVRELENVLERAVILASGDVLDIPVELLPAPAAAEPEPSTGLKASERRQILDALARTNWVIEGERGAARVLDMHPNTLRSRIKKLGLSRPG
ncbi:MAG TPA: sigma 54-interacting transcriptional regulator [Candidatus Polarisedimenticolaceae bacterium]